MFLSPLPAYIHHGSAVKLSVAVVLMCGSSMNCGRGGVFDEHGHKKSSDALITLTPSRFIFYLVSPKGENNKFRRSK